MPRKHGRPEAQVERLAAQLQERWTAADGIMPWLRRRLPLLTRLNQEEGWSWADIGRALNAAGISYETGHAWTGALLARKVSQARTQMRDRQARRENAVEAAPARSSRATGLPIRGKEVRMPLPSTPDAGERVPSFAPASLASGTFRSPARSREGGEIRKPAATQKRVDVDAVIRRLQGGDAGSDNGE